MPSRPPRTEVAWRSDDRGERAVFSSTVAPCERPGWTGAAVTTIRRRVTGAGTVTNGGLLSSQGNIRLGFAGKRHRGRRIARHRGPDQSRLRPPSEPGAACNGRNADGDHGQGDGRFRDRREDEIEGVSGLGDREAAARQIIGKAGGAVGGRRDHRRMRRPKPLIPPGAVTSVQVPGCDGSKLRAGPSVSGPVADRLQRFTLKGRPMWR